MDDHRNVLNQMLAREARDTFAGGDVFHQRAAALRWALTQIDQRDRLLEALIKLWKHTPKIDDGRCMVCRVGFCNWVREDAGEVLAVGECSDSRCLSHVVRSALASVKEGGGT